MNWPLVTRRRYLRELKEAWTAAANAEMREQTQRHANDDLFAQLESATSERRQLGLQLAESERTCSEWREEAQKQANKCEQLREQRQRLLEERNRSRGATP